MLTRTALRVPRRWPIWLLTAAWLCANGPQMACFEVVVWLKGAGHFSHYHRLAASAAAALEGRAEAEPQWAATVAQKPLPVSIPAEATMKKIELGAPEARDPLGFTRWVAIQGTAMPGLPPVPVADVPHPPPRSEV